MTRVLEVFADVMCPFAHIGLARVAERRDASGADVVLAVKAWPLELINGAPLAPDFVAEEIDILRAGVAPDLFAGFDAATFPTTTLPALDLAHAAALVDVAIGERVSLALRRALWEEGRDLADPAVLAAIAAEHGVVTDARRDRAGVLAEWDDGKARGVRGSPEFVLDGAGWFCPSLNVRRVDGDLVVDVDADTMHEFLDTVFPA
ncbi:MAG: DsbA family protein [Actinomycetes bacterium]